MPAGRALSLLLESGIGVPIIPAIPTRCMSLLEITDSYALSPQPPMQPSCNNVAVTDGIRQTPVARDNAELKTCKQRKTLRLPV